MHQTHVIRNLKTLKTLLDGRQHLQHSLLFLFREMERIRYREVIVEVMANAPGVAPAVDPIDQCAHT